MKFLVIPLALAFSLAAPAQMTIFPAGMTGSGGNAIPFRASFTNDIRYQLRIPAAQLPGVPTQITDLLFLPSATATSNSLVMPQFELSLGISPSALTCNLAANAPAQQVQFNGSHTYTYTPGSFSSIGVPIAYFYDGVSDLLIELRIQGSTGGDAFVSAGSVIQRVYNRLTGGYNATTCSHQPSSGILVGITHQPGPVPFTLQATTTGGGVGDLTLSLNGVPGDTVEGWTVYSLNTSSGVGTGPIFGLKPDLNLSILVTAFPFASPGNPVHWTWPASGVYPSVPFNAPAGTFSGLAGQDADFLAIAVGNTGVLTPTSTQRLGF